MLFSAERSCTLWIDFFSLFAVSLFETYFCLLISFNYKIASLRTYSQRSISSVYPDEISDRFCRSTTILMQMREAARFALFKVALYFRAYTSRTPDALSRRTLRHRGCVARARRNIPSRAGHTNRRCYYERKQGGESWFSRGLSARA